MKSLIVTAAAVVALAASGLSAEAACGGSALRLGARAPITAPVPPSGLHAYASAKGSSIVGMWNVQYTNDGNLVFQSLEQWHSDGLEFEFADIPTISGDICMGVWSRKGKTYSLYHTGWTFDSSGNPNGTMVLTHEDKVARDGNTYSGTFDLRFYDVNGKLLNEITGDDNATRIPAP